MLRVDTLGHGPPVDLLEPFDRVDRLVHRGIVPIPRVLLQLARDEAPGRRRVLPHSA
jgi:hypothetical protein